MGEAVLPTGGEAGASAGESVPLEANAVLAEGLNMLQLVMF